ATPAGVRSGVASVSTTHCLPGGSMRARIVLVSIAIVLIAAACGNSGSSKATDTPLPSGRPTTTVSAADLKKNVPVSAPGVTSTEINVATIVSKTNNPTGASYDPHVGGMKAYFQMDHDAGGTDGRKL